MNVTLLSPHPKGQERRYHPLANQQSNEIISDFVEMSDTNACFLHIQLLGTNVRLPKIRKIPPDVNLQDLLQKPSLEIDSIDNLQLSYPHDNIVGSHVCDEFKKSNEQAPVTGSIPFL